MADHQLEQMTIAAIPAQHRLVHGGTSIESAGGCGRHASLEHAGDHRIARATLIALDHGRPDAATFTLTLNADVQGPEAAKSP